MQEEGGREEKGRYDERGQLTSKHFRKEDHKEGEIERYEGDTEKKRIRTEEEDKITKREETMEGS